MISPGIPYVQFLGNLLLCVYASTRKNKEGVYVNLFFKHHNL